MQKVLSQRDGYGRLTAVNVELSSGVQQVEVDRAFADPQNEAGLPTCFAKRHPFEAFEFSFRELRSGHEVSGSCRC